jgi:hypothetical protein
MASNVYQHPFRVRGVPQDSGENDPDKSWDTITRNRHKGNEHSLAAAASISPKARASIREKVLGFISAHPEGVTYEEVVAGLNLFHPTISSAISVLKKHSLVRVGGERPTSRGRMAAVYFVLEGGKPSNGGI